MSRTGQIDIARVHELERNGCLPEDPLATVFAGVEAARVAAKQARIQARKAAKGRPNNGPNCGLPTELSVEPKRPVLIGFGGGSDAYPEVHLPAGPEELRLSDEDWLILAQAASLGALGQ